MNNRLRIGIDFDNTIVDYDRVFHAAAVEAGWIGDGDFPTEMSKRQLRDTIRSLPDGETKWQTLQARVYGPMMREARFTPGAEAFFRRCKDEGADVFVVSHKTKYATLDQEGVNLREAASAWMAKQGLYEEDRYGIPKQHVFFEATRDAKVRRISELGCTHFIDDLVEVFAHPGFPDDVHRYLYAPDGGPESESGGPGSRGADCPAYRSWEMIADAVFSAG